MTTPTHEAATGPATDQPDLDALHHRSETLRAEVGNLTAENQQLRAHHEDFLVHLGARAKEVAEENDWCSVAQNLVEELGGVWPAETVYDFTVTHTWRIRAHLAPGVDPDQVTETSIADSLRLWETPSMDDDWTNCIPIETVGFHITQYAAITE